MTARATASVALLVGFSLMVYVTWEIGMMVRRTLVHRKFDTLVQRTPGDLAKAIGEFCDSRPG